MALFHFLVGKHSGAEVEVAEPSWAVDDGVVVEDVAGCDRKSPQRLAALPCRKGRQLGWMTGSFLGKSSTWMLSSPNLHTFSPYFQTSSQGSAPQHPAPSAWSSGG